ncbi:hypothetical protein CcrKarma_gp141 [Caulobacter virus Karma]|uniref:Uncharacterized protein n=3 Tax=Shapirovirus cbk TaxID=1204537 RepID=K4JPP0_9CAUD|nr:hypothetical protein D865_gp279 [Caulobacter phage phiCbK]YP_006989521.1 hypothetical protein CcrKarma_gp141 [Caulobacter virus Karma]ARB15053.1 hypothetical protein Ccr32_gp135 [Caulobacter phage Ccr32]ARB15386.1 hypothetical protein Ccr34_gp144 [Caulobacter phage Ccr34]AFU86971.1 hypothetical protein CbK_gp139 [Caulobacter phage phiCbK]AFU87658.1 hypothetical protein CcrKarma_gp141 [Caulobacter virus Karma]
MSECVADPSSEAFWLCQHTPACRDVVNLDVPRRLRHARIHAEHHG